MLGRQATDTMTLLDDPELSLKHLAADPTQEFEFKSLLGCGKSAAVFEAKSKSGALVALKVYDQQRLAKFGREVQAERMSRELSLAGHDCRDLVQVLASGTLLFQNQDHPYIALELVPGHDLRDLISARRFSDTEIRQHLGSLYRAASFLEKRGLCHRDIKPENCRVREDGTLVLLDLGVLRPIAASELTDDAEDPRIRYFLGTLRYGPPELLFRNEGNSPDAWRAINVYQIGAVLYELIHGTLLFSHIREPYSELVLTVKETTPTVMRSDIGRDLVTLVRNCLVKDPSERLRLVPWESLEVIARSSPAPEVSRSKLDLSSRLRQASDEYELSVESKQREASALAKRRKETMSAVVAAVTEGLRIPDLEDLAPNIMRFDVGSSQTVVLALPANIRLGFAWPCWLACSIQLPGRGFEVTQISALGFYGDLPEVIGRTRPAFPNQSPEQKLAPILHTSELSSASELLLDEPPSPAQVTGIVRDWAESMVERYLELTAADLETERRHLQERIGKSFYSYERISKCTAFNRTRVMSLPRSIR